MPDYTVTRQEMIDALARAMAAQHWVRAAWLGGSDASGRTDALSDIDMQFIVEDDRVEDAFDAIHAALADLSPITQRFRFPEPAWHGHSQELLMLADADPDHFLDLVVMKVSGGDRFLEVERHGVAMALFDRDGLLAPPPMDWDAHLAKMRGRLETLRAQFPLFQPMVSKAVRRGLPVEAAAGYQAVTLRPLIELLRMRHCPERFDYGSRYLDRDLPDRWREELEALSLPASLAELGACQARAANLFDEQLAALDRGEWAIARPVAGD
jgi:hypothetical protein